MFFAKSAEGTDSKRFSLRSGAKECGKSAQRHDLQGVKFCDFCCKERKGRGPWRFVVLPESKYTTERKKVKENRTVYGFSGAGALGLANLRR
jgi:hypothetical protein